MTPKERDLKQAVCHLPGTPAGSCFHIGQAWFLILENSFIISCSGLSTAELIKKSISIVPHRSNSPELPMRTLLVSGYGSTLWSLPLGECKTWIVRNLNVYFSFKIIVTDVHLGLFETFLGAMATKIRVFLWRKQDHIKGLAKDIQASREVES
ncbi:hypothetical protein DSL72_001704 [Monilinia vaccinii-corymbosi]|uniref:Uncharacterized protein n=1 Tax=Monilinia vaccinii-corymbosi TaxID=61207 RepID=A0A8A3P2N0_9HELO|nr:hypothetical protein DSL72_001704 [Monilinia vaccinii-corymbosi]